MWSGSRRRCGGFTYLALLVAVAAVGAGLAAGGELWSQGERRERERELLFMGNQFREAIRSYYESSPGVNKNYPQDLAELLLDRRYPEPRRHLRRIYRDPMTGNAEWKVLEAPSGGIMGVRSLSDRETLKRSGFTTENRAFEGATRYSEWHFIYLPASSPSPSGLRQPR